MGDAHGSMEEQMARKVQVILEDDIDGGEASRTVEFSFDGVRYEIDLNDDNAAALEKALEPYVQHARRVGGRRGSGTRRSGGGNSARNNEIRTWAREQGMEVSERGRIAASVVEAYDKAH